MNNLALVQSLYIAFAQRDRETILRLFAPDIEWIQNEGFPSGGRHVGAESVLDNVFARFRTEWKTWEANVHEWIEAGETIVALGEYRGTHQLTGKSMTAAFAHVYRIATGRIKKFQQFTDTLKIAEAMKA